MWRTLASTFKDMGSSAHPAGEPVVLRLNEARILVVGSYRGKPWGLKVLDLLAAAHWSNRRE